MKVDKLMIIGAQSGIIEDYVMLISQCLGLLCCILEDKMPKNEAKYEEYKLEKRFLEIRRTYRMAIRPQVKRVMGRSLEQIMNELGLEPPGDR